MRNLFYLGLISAYLTSCCSSINIDNISSNFIINKIVQDYSSSKKSYLKKYSVFLIERKNNNDQNIEVFTTIPLIDQTPFRIFLDDSINNERIPTHYFESKGKVFLWREGNKKSPDSVLKYIYDKGMLDSTYVKYQMGLISESQIQNITSIMNESIEGVTYVFCKANPKIIVKKITSSKYIKANDERLNVKCNKP